MNKEYDDNGELVADYDEEDEIAAVPVGVVFGNTNKKRGRVEESSTGMISSSSGGDNKGISQVEKYRNKRANTIKERSITCLIPENVFLVNLIGGGDLIGFVLLNHSCIDTFLERELKIDRKKFGFDGKRKIPIQLPTYEWNRLRYAWERRFGENSKEEAFLKSILRIGCGSSGGQNSNGGYYFESFVMLTKFSLAIEPADFDGIYDNVKKYLALEPLSQASSSSGKVVKMIEKDVFVEHWGEIKALEYCLVYDDVRYPLPFRH